jgi:hypothetical protein
MVSFSFSVTVTTTVTVGVPLAGTAVGPVGCWIELVPSIGTTIRGDLDVAVGRGRRRRPLDEVDDIVGSFRGAVAVSVSLEIVVVTVEVTASPALSLLVVDEDGSPTVTMTVAVTVG